MSTVTVRARLTEGVTKGGIGFPSSVRITGGQFLSRNAAQELAQQAIDEVYGEYESSFLAVINIDRWNEYHDAGTDNGFDVPVVKL